MFTKNMECLDCGFSGKAARELTYCPHCQSSNILTMTHRQERRAKHRRNEAMLKLADALMQEEQAIQDVFSQLSHL